MTPARYSPRSTLWVPPEERPELPDVRATDEHIARLAALYGLLPHLPAIPASLGAGAALPLHDLGAPAVRPGSAAW